MFKKLKQNLITRRHKKQIKDYFAQVIAEAKITLYKDIYFQWKEICNDQYRLVFFGSTSVDSFLSEIIVWNIKGDSKMVYSYSCSSYAERTIFEDGDWFDIVENYIKN